MKEKTNEKIPYSGIVGYQNPKNQRRLNFVKTACFYLTIIFDLDSTFNITFLCILDG